MTQCYYGTLSEVQSACDKVYVNMLREVAEDADGTLYVDPEHSNQKVTAYAKLDSELLAMDIPVLSRKMGVLQKTSGFTMRWDAPRQCYDDPNKYWACIPRPELTVGVQCPTASYASSWEYAPEDV